MLGCSKSDGKKTALTKEDECIGEYCSVVLREKRCDGVRERALGTLWLEKKWDGHIRSRRCSYSRNRKV